MTKQKGFTLVEIAIVLVIIGLMTGGVLKGQALIQNAKVRNTISQMDELKASIYGFQDRYRALPGDMAKARTIVGNGAVDCKTSCDNGQINVWKNASLVTNHLSAAEFYSGPTNRKEIDGSPAVLTEGAGPKNPWGGIMFTAYWNQYNDKGKASKTARNGVYTGKAMPANVLAEIDRKIDDGKPRTGTFRSSWPFIATAGCVKGNTWVVTNPRADCSGISLY